MIEATITKPRRIGGNRHQCRVTAEFLLHGTDRTS
jgi:hypothetical protein